ncbi:MAG: hypothetical protein E7612_06530 [Ruminococcaceae bacterium]|nr:hypothetical protein [Oscillospiraceae bacterium]
MKIWNSITNFILSDLYLYICAGIMVGVLIAWIVYKIVEHIYVNKGYEEWCNNLRKYGIPDEFEAPKYVWNHIEHLIWLAEEYNLDSLYEAQDKFDGLYTSHYRSINLSGEDMERFWAMDSNERESVLKFMADCEGIERKNNLEESNNG